MNNVRCIFCQKCTPVFLCSLACRLSCLPQIGRQWSGSRLYPCLEWSGCEWTSEIWVQVWCHVSVAFKGCHLLLCLFLGAWYANSMMSKVICLFCQICTQVCAFPCKLVVSQNGVAMSRHQKCWVTTHCNVSLAFWRYVLVPFPCLFPGAWHAKSMMNKCVAYILPYWKNHGGPAWDEKFCECVVEVAA